MEYKRESKNSTVIVILAYIVFFAVTGYPQETNNGNISNFHGIKYIESEFCSKQSHQDAFLARDKLKHFIGSMITSAFFYRLSEENFAWSQTGAICFGIGITASIGIGKEVYDSQKRGGRFSWKDLLADGLGIFTGILIATQ